MIITKAKVVSAIATGTLVLNMFATSAFAATDIEISGNGSFSDNKAKINKSVNTTVVQSNSAYVSNNVSSKASTGGNQANDNTGGDVAIATGNATSRTDLTTKVNLNHAEVNNCDCEGDAEILISGNGSESDNKVKLNSQNNTSLFQDNTAKIKNNVDADAKTGHNDANRNTGGDVTVVTGNANTEVDILNKANANVAEVGSNGNGGSAGTVDARITGNGSFSDNKIKLNLDRSVTLVQDNKAKISNWVDANAKTGHNEAKDNTAGDVVIDTGNATARVDIDNLANFNAADIDCGCVTDVNAKISGNGFESDSKIKAHLNDNVNLYQDNKAKLKNWVDTNAKTGKNEANRNTGAVEAVSDPFILTGHALSEDSVTNAANVNLASSGEGSGNHGVEFDFDLEDILRSLHLR